MKRQFSLYRSLSKFLRLPLAGPLFKRYAPRRSWDVPDGPRSATRVVIVNLMPSLGDTICYMALVETLAKARPEIEISWMADPGLCGLIRKHPNVAHVYPITIAPRALLRIPTLKSYYRLFSITRSVLRLALPHQFDLAIVPRGGVDPSFSAHAAWVLNVPCSVGYSHLVEPEEMDHGFPDDLLTTVVRHITVLHEAARAVHLLEVSGVVPNALSRWTPEDSIQGVHTVADSADWSRLCLRIGLPETRPYVVLSPGAGVANRAWPAEKFRALCERLVAQGNVSVVITGTSSEVDLAAAVAGESSERVVLCAGELNLAELAAVLKHAAAFVGNDSGAGHIAGPLDTPTISLHTQAIGSNPAHIRAPQHGRPLGRHVTVLQPDRFEAPCSERCESLVPHCIDRISVEQVWNALRAALPSLV